VRVSNLAPIIDFAFILALTLPALGPSAHAKPRVILPVLLHQVESKYVKAGTLSAELVQITENPATNQKKTGSGTIQIKHPDKIRWEMKSPDKSLLVSNGQSMWFYTPPFDAEDRGKVRVLPASQAQSRLANALLSGRFSQVVGISITEQGKNNYLIVPKPGTAGTVLNAVVQIDPDTKLIGNLTLENSGGNKTEIKLSKIVLGGPLDDKLFVFEAPPNTDVEKE